MIRADQAKHKTTDINSGKYKEAAERLEILIEAEVEKGNFSLSLPNLNSDIRIRYSQIAKDHGYNVEWNTGHQRDPCNILIISWR